ncbi:MAG TPA: FecR domain-containing protein, partial [Polyangia bacterium]|nr:FecR domain-containing protein [Polyangia bacterium]
MTSQQPGDEPQDAPALVALSELARDAVQPHTAGELDQGLDAVVGRLAAGRVRRGALRRWALVGAAAAACGTAALMVKVRSGAREGAPGRDPSVVLSRIEGGTLLEGGYLSQSGAAGVKVVFSEGTTFQLMPGTRGKLRAVARDGAHFAVEHGTASFGVTPSRDHQWLVEAGPFLVTVKGTVFTVSWDSSAERFELRLRQGHVLVTGPVVNGGIALRAGQRLVVSLPRAETVITEDKPAVASSAAVPAEAPVTP